jgi:omega-6 fatty acid desaturase (delta-12 desaturase)
MLLEQELDTDSRAGAEPTAEQSPPVADNHAWREILAPYAEPRLARSLLEIATSVVPYLALSVLIYLSISTSVLIALALAIPTAGFLVRTFILFHDCTHGSLLKSRRGNAWLGSVLGLFVLAPFTRWRHDHAVHHATAGDLGRRGVGDVLTLTVSEYNARSPRGRVGYRLLRSPLVMFGIGPIVAMIIGPRIATRAQRPRLRRSVLWTDLALAVLAGGLGFLLGWDKFLLTWAPAAMLAGSAGIWLFYVQHQFEDAQWQSSDEWSFAEAALHGSSYLKLPKVLQFFSGNIGLHHVHHLNARIPNYNLQRAHDDNAIFHGVPTVTLIDGIRAVRLKLWDEERGALLTFAQARRQPGTASLAGPGGSEPAPATPS